MDTNQEVTVGVTRREFRLQHQRQTDKPGGVSEERNESPLGRNGVSFYAFLMMMGGSQFKPAAILTDFQAAGRRRDGDQMCGHSFPNCKTLSPGNLFAGHRVSPVCQSVSLREESSS